MTTKSPDALLPCPFCQERKFLEMTDAFGKPRWMHTAHGSCMLRCFVIDDVELWNTRNHPTAATPASEGCIKWPDYMTAADFHFLKGLRVFITSREKIFQPTGVEMFDDLIARLEAGFSTCGVTIND